MREFADAVLTFCAVMGAGILCVLTVGIFFVAKEWMWERRSRSIRCSNFYKMFRELRSGANEMHEMWLESHGPCEATEYLKEVLERANEQP